MGLFDDAKAADLPAWMDAEGYFLRHQGGSYGCHACPHCGEGDPQSNALSVFRSDSGQGIWRYRCWRCGKGGSVVDFIATVRGMSATEAAKMLVSGAQTSGFVRAAAPPKTKTNLKPLQQSPKQLADSKKVFELIRTKGLSTEPGVRSYLESRRISASLQNEAFARNMLRMLPANPAQAMEWLLENVGEELLESAGFWKQESKWPPIAFRPLIFLLPNDSGAEFRLARDPNGDEPKALRYGRLNWPWWWKGNTDKVIAVEGAIDMLSLVAMNWESSILAAPGVNAWKDSWLDNIADKYPGILFHTGFDNDVAGDQATQRVAEYQLEKGRFSVSTNPPKAFKDWNKYLVGSPVAKTA